MNEYQDYIKELKALSPHDFDMLVATLIFDAKPKNIVTKQNEEYSGYILSTGEWYTDENLIEYVGSDESFLAIIRRMDDMGYEIYIAITRMTDGSSGKVIGFISPEQDFTAEHPSIFCQNVDVYDLATAALLAIKFRV